MRFMRSILALLILAVPAATSSASAQTLEGHWEGAIEIPGSPLAINVDFARDGDTWKGDITIPAQGARDLPLADVTLDHVDVSFAIAGVPGEPTFRGTLSEDGGTIQGQFTQSGQTFPFKLEAAESPAATAAGSLEELDAMIPAALEDWKTPGLALAVVVDGKVALSRGYGLRDVDGKLPVTSRTLFAIGSATKAFTTFVLGTLVDQGKLDWDRPVAEYLPGFKLYDEYATAHLTPRDMACHRSGLPRHDLVWYNNEDLTRAELVRRLRYLEPNKNLRETWQYNNLMFMTLGYLVEQRTGATWEDVVRTRVFEPLGMTHSNFSVDESERDDDHATPYREKDGKIQKIPFRPIRVMAPAGAINSCADDMARWLLVQLGDGKVDGKRILSAATLREIHTPQMVLPGMPKEPYVSPESYGLGWFVDTWRGHFRVHHGGNIDGFSALVVLFPRDGAGVVVLVNKTASALPELVAATAADRILGLDPRNWIAEAAARRDKAKPVVDEAKKKKEQFRVRGTSPSREPTAYAGEYEHPGYGTVEVRVRGDHLVLVMNRMEMPLEHWHYDVFNVKESREEVIPENLRVEFEGDFDGDIARLKMPLEPMVEPIVFHGLPPRRLHDPVFLSRLTGDYVLPTQTISIRLRGDVLVAEIEGGPTLNLVPSGDNKFDLKGITGITLRFVVPAEGPATELIAVQPEGVYTAPRKKEE